MEKVKTLNDKAVEAIARELSRSPIDGTSYASETVFLARFARHLDGVRTWSRALMEGQIGVLDRLARLHDTDARVSANSIFTKNLSILYDDLYLQACLFPRLREVRLNLAKMRARFGVLAIKGFPEAAGEANPFYRERSWMFLWSRRVLRHFVAGQLRRALRRALDFIDPRSLAAPAFPSVIRAWATSPERLERLMDFRRRLSAVVEAEGLPPFAPSAWTLALSCCDGDQALALELLGAIVAQRKGPLRFAQREALRPPDGRDQSFDGLAAAAESFFLLGVLHEKSLRCSGLSLLYPSGAPSESPKFWHFYSAALVAHHLALFPENIVRRANLLIGAAYELFSIPFNIRLVAPQGARNALSRNFAEMLRDVRLHRAGGCFGRRTARPAEAIPSATTPVTPFHPPPRGFE